MATLLIVAPNPTDRHPFITLLGNYGYRLVEARDGIQALELVRAELPDLIITDILMPNMDGFTLVRRLWAEPLLMGVPVIFQTASYDLAEIHKLSQASGIQYILRKPAEPQQILRAVNASLKRPVTHEDLTPRSTIAFLHDDTGNSLAKELRQIIVMCH